MQKVFSNWFMFGYSVVCLVFSDLRASTLIGWSIFRPILIGWSVSRLLVSAKATRYCWMNNMEVNCRLGKINLRCMYGHHLYSKGKDQTGKVSNPWEAAVNHLLLI